MSIVQDRPPAAPPEPEPQPQIEPTLHRPREARTRPHLAPAWQDGPRRRQPDVLHIGFGVIQMLLDAALVAAAFVVAYLLRFNSDKTSYKVGETAQIQLPESQAGRALLTVETSSQILEQRWLEFNGQRTQIGLPITAAMSPNAYVSISLLQAHQGKQNDRPLRLYGILPIVVDDPNTQLTPTIKAAEEWKPESTQSFTVTEQSGRSMDYTVAVVDEGLLGLTRYESPDLHKVFYRKEALGIKTWDLFDSVIGAYSGNLERMLAI